ncbi:hypothetical protein NKG94_37265 [Micromonospora sp. M12]
MDLGDLAEVRGGDLAGPTVLGVRHSGRRWGTSFLWVHALLIAASLVIGTTVGVLGVRAWFAARRRAAS